MGTHLCHFVLIWKQQKKFGHDKKNCILFIFGPFFNHSCGFFDLVRAKFDLPFFRKILKNALILLMIHMMIDQNYGLFK